MSKLSRFKNIVTSSKKHLEVAKDSTPTDFSIIVLGVFKILGINPQKIQYGFAVSKLQGNTVCNAYTKFFDKIDYSDLKRLTKFLDSKAAYFSIAHVDKEFVEFQISINEIVDTNEIYEVFEKHNLKTIGKQK